MRRFAVVLLVCFSFSSLYSQDAMTLKNEGNKAMSAQQWAIALAKYEKALSVWGNRPADQAMIFSMGACAYRVNDMKKSLKYIDMSIAAGHNLDMAYQYRVCIMKAQNNNDGYLKTLKEGLAKVPNSKVMKETLAKLYFTEGDKHYHEALEIMRNAVAQVKAGKYPASDKAFKDQNDRARTDFKEAMKFMNMSLELNPNDEKAKTVKTNCQNQLNMLI
jgi:tetratricopeptide (TPR) repeat protein